MAAHDVASYVGNSYFEVAGAGMNFSRMFGVDAEYMYYDLGFRPSVIRSEPDTPKRKYAVDKPGRHRQRAPPYGKLGAYGIFGIGFYRPQRFSTQPDRRAAQATSLRGDGGT